MVKSVQKEATISYKLDVDLTDGTIYNQRIRITPKTFKRLSDAINEEIQNGYRNKISYINVPGHECFLKPLYNSGGVYFLNHIQRRYINTFLKLNLNFKHNTYLNIK